MTITANDLAQFTGTEQYYRHPMIGGFVYTDGVKYLAEKAGAYWLIDDIALYMRVTPSLQNEDFVVWRLGVEDNFGTLVAEDGNNNMLFAKDIEFTDFPLDQIKLWFTGGIMMLPTEY